ncbi:hypothetical protein PZA11_007061 [Diplocarpon coronariae]|nr:hypothetical protein JHW43_009400 [Diplocarpon mali]
MKAFRTLSNTLIFYASFANLFANVAALIGGSALGNVDGGLCQFQGFLLEIFMQSDPMWSCAMAVNVYLVFFRRYDAARLKSLYWIYAIICYGLPLIPAMFCLFYRTEAKGRIYGDATLWCWIDTRWAPVRIYSYYAPIWFAILLTFVIYVRVGVEIFQKRSELHKAGYDQSCASATIASTTDQPPFIPLPPLAPFSGLRTTEIQITHSLDLWSFPLPPSHHRSFSHFSSHSSPEKPSQDPYSITIVSSPPATATPCPVAATTGTTSNLPRRPSSMDKVKWAYTRCALLFAVSILLTWVPASVNRVHDLRYPGRPSFALNVGSALVLPLQGFWNAVIYFATSKEVWRDCWADDEGSGEVNTARREGDGIGLRKVRSGGESLVRLSARERRSEGSVGFF